MKKVQLSLYLTAHQNDYKRFICEGKFPLFDRKKQPHSSGWDCFYQSVGMRSGWLLRSRVTKCVERERILRKLDASPWGEGSYQAKFSTKHTKNMHLFL